MDNQKKSSPKPEAPSWKIIITILGRHITGKGHTFEEACQNLDMKWPDIKGKGLITVWKGGVKKEKLVNKPQIVRLVSNPLTQQQWATNFEILFR